jgi:hypothetical protein
MKTEFRRICPSCGHEFSGAVKFCPVCMLRKGLLGGVASGASSFEEAAKPTPIRALQRFEHYQLVAGGDGRPVELGRGAMGVTFKAFDINLRCPVTLKVICASDIWVIDQRSFVFCAKPERRRPFAIRMLPQCCTWAEPVRTTSTQWSSRREKPSKNVT